MSRSSASNTSSGATGPMCRSSRTMSARYTPERCRRPASVTVCPTSGPRSSTSRCNAKFRSDSNASFVGSDRSGISLWATKTKTNSPATAAGRPTGVSSKSPNGRCPCCSRTPETTRLVDVPMRVMTPPRIAANDRGIRKRDTGSRLERAHDDTSGNSIATRGVLLNTDDNPATGTQSRAMDARPPLPPRTRPVNPAKRPVRLAPAATT